METMKKAYDVGREIASQGHILLTGGCGGIPYEAARGASEGNGKTVAYSPAKNIKEHMELYGFPVKGFTKIIYTGMGIPGRNQNLIENADRVILIAGKIGTLNEFTLAYIFGKPIGILEGSGGLTEFIETIEKRCDNRGSVIIYESEPKKLVEKIISI